MALQKDIELETGVIASYWRAGFIHIDMDNDRCVVTMFGYKSEQDRIDGKQAIDMKAFEYKQLENPMTIDEMSEDGNNPVKIAYTYLKQINPLFSGALDV